MSLLSDSGPRRVFNPWPDPVQSVGKRNTKEDEKSDVIETLKDVLATRKVKSDGVAKIKDHDKDAGNDRPQEWIHGEGSLGVRLISRDPRRARKALAQRAPEAEAPASSEPRIDARSKEASGGGIPKPKARHQPRKNVRNSITAGAVQITKEEQGESESVIEQQVESRGTTSFRLSSSAGEDHKLHAKSDKDRSSTISSSVPVRRSSRLYRSNEAQETEKNMGFKDTLKGSESNFARDIERRRGGGRQHETIGSVRKLSSKIVDEARVQSKRARVIEDDDKFLEKVYEREEAEERALKHYRRKARRDSSEGIMDFSDGDNVTEETVTRRKKRRGPQKNASDTESEDEGESSDRRRGASTRTLAVSSLRREKKKIIDQALDEDNWSLKDVIRWANANDRRDAAAKTKAAAPVVEGGEGGDGVSENHSDSKGSKSSPERHSNKRNRSSSLLIDAPEKKSASMTAFPTQSPRKEGPTSSQRRSASYAGHGSATAALNTQCEDEETHRSPIAPQVQVGADGKLVVNVDSLTVQAQEKQRYTRVVTEQGSRVASLRSSRKLSNEKWNAEDTELFFKALSQFGTDFTLIAHLFPGRQRRHMKNKFNRESKINLDRVNEALQQSETMNRDSYKDMIALLKESGMSVGGSIDESVEQKESQDVGRSVPE